MESEDSLSVAEGGKKKFDSLSRILERTVHAHEYSVWAEETPKPLKNGLLHTLRASTRKYSR